MKIEFLGHACFLLTAEDGTRIVTDPYESGGLGGAVGYGPVGVDADAVTVSHGHGDHAHVESVGGDPAVIDAAAGGAVGSVRVRGVETWHDAAGGAQRGANLVFVFEADGLRLAHLGDLGHALVPDQMDALGAVDVALVPVGGFYTIDASTAAAIADALGARVTIPMHYKTEKLGFDIAPVSAFVELQPDRVRELGSSECEITADTLPDRPEVWVLTPAR
ncbi:MAG: MBL fold metallo-hydrolase [Planctomycetota bacterium]